MTIEAITVQIAKLELKAGDTLAIMVPQVLSKAQHDEAAAVLEGLLPEGVKALILDGGVTFTKLTTPELVSMDHIITLRPRPLHRRFINSCRAWRQNLGVWESLRAAWIIAQSKPAQKQPQSAHYDPKQFRR